EHHARLTVHADPAELGLLSRSPSEPPDGTGNRFPGDAGRCQHWDDLSPGSDLRRPVSSSRRSTARTSVLRARTARAIALLVKPEFWLTTSTMRTASVGALVKVTSCRCRLVALRSDGVWYSRGRA